MRVSAPLCMHVPCLSLLEASWTCKRCCSATAAAGPWRKLCMLGTLAHLSAGPAAYRACRQGVSARDMARQAQALPGHAMQGACGAAYLCSSSLPPGAFLNDACQLGLRQLQLLPRAGMLQHQRAHIAAQTARGQPTSAAAACRLLRSLLAQVRLPSVRCRYLPC